MIVDISEDMLENLLLIHLNPEVYYAIRDSEVKQLEEKIELRA